MVEVEVEDFGAGEERGSSGTEGSLRVNERPSYPQWQELSLWLGQMEAVDESSNVAAS